MNKTAAANLISPIIERDAAEWLKRERTGHSASMNGALDYTASEIMDTLIKAGWSCPFKKTQ